MQTTVIVSVLQDIALVLFCLGLVLGVAMSCDLRVAEMVADDPGMAWRFTVVGPGTQRDMPLLPLGSPGGELR